MQPKFNVHTTKFNIKQHYSKHIKTPHFFNIQDSNTQKQANTDTYQKMEHTYMEAQH